MTKVTNSVDLQVRTATAHPNLNMPSLVAEMFMLEADDYGETSLESDLSLVIRCLLAIAPIKEVRGWLAEIRNSPTQYHQIKEEQMIRFSKVL